jgi:uncharacterized protein (TIGR00369 family)
MLKAGATPLAAEFDFAECAGLRCVAVGEDRATVLLEAGSQAAAERGGVHRGAISALVEAAGSAAVGHEAPEEDPELGSVDLFISFVRTPPIQPLTADAFVIRREAGLVVCDVEVRDWDRELVAKAVFTYHG